MAFNNLGDKFKDTRKTESVPGDVTTITELHDHIENEFNKKVNRDKVDDIYKRTTFLIDKKLEERLNVLMRGKKKGWKTMAFNKAVAALVQEYEHINPNRDKMNM